MMDIILADRQRRECQVSQEMVNVTMGAYASRSVPVRGAEMRFA